MSLSATPNRMTCVSLPSPDESPINNTPIINKEIFSNIQEIGKVNQNIIKGIPRNSILNNRERNCPKICHKNILLLFRR